VSQQPYREDLGYYEDRAEGLLASAEDGTETALAVFRRSGAPLTPGGARIALARAHGADWGALRERVRSPALAEEPFARAYRAIEARDPDALGDLLERVPGIVAVRGTNDNDLLGMATATGDERLVALLLGKGADPRRGNVHGWTPLHQAAYLGRLDLTEMLLEAGAPADVSARGDGGTPLVAALFWGNREVAEVLAEHGLHPRNLRVAARLGRVDLIDELAGTPQAGAHRAFYRPHGGFPAWQPSDDPQEVLDEALAWAARSDRVDALDGLLAHGARLEADVYRGTALMWAAASGRAAAIRRLVALGADPDGRSTFGGPEHGVGTVPLHLAAQSGHLDAIEALLDAGADTTIRDELYGGTPADWAEHGCNAEAAELLRAHASNERHPTSG
jgi:ankyrin repeat protein